MSQEQQDYSKLADEIRNASNQLSETPEQAPVAHAGGENVPEDVRERPVDGASVPIDPNVAPEDVVVPESPAHIDLGPDERDHPTLANLAQPTETQPFPVQTDEPGKKSRRGIAIGAAGAILATLIGGGAYFGLNRGSDHSSEATDPNTQPTPTATTSESPTSQPSASETTAAPASSVLDSSVDGSVKANHAPITAPVFTEMANHVGDHVSYDSVNRLVDSQALQEMRNSSDPVNQNFLREYVDNPNGMANLFNGDQSGAALLQSIYNNTVAFESQFYGNHQNFKGADTAKLIGELPYATHQDIDDAYSSGDVTTLFNKLFNSNQANIYKVLKSEAAAGNDDLDLANNLAQWSLETQILPNYSDLQPQVAQDYQTRMDALKKDPNTYLPTLNGEIKSAKILYVSREIVGGQQAINNDPEYQYVKQAEITTMVATVNGTLEVIALVPVPGHTGKAEGLQAVTIASAS